MNDLPEAVVAELIARLGEEVDNVQPLYGDVSARRFFRLGYSGGSAVLILYPAEPEPDLLRDYTMMTSFALAGLGPSILARGDRWFLVRDGGEEDLAARLERSSPAERSAAVCRALDLVPQIQALPGGIQDLNPPLGEERLARELDYTLRWFIEGSMLGMPGTYRPVLDRIAREVGSFRRAFCHRDYHANNILVRDDRLLLVDVQDACLGPRFYDVVSLVNERAVASMLSRNERWELIRRCVEDNLRIPWDEAVEREVRVTSLQRTLKALGTFAAQLLKGREEYRPHFEAGRVILGELLAHLESYSPLSDLAINPEKGGLRDE